jgi:putative transposase
MDNQIPLFPYGHYHLYNHAVGKENLFSTDSDYAHYLEGLKKYILPVADVLSYCLMPNHFHLVLRMKSETEIKLHLQSLSRRPIDFDELMKTNRYIVTDKISQVFSNFFNAYAKHYNALNSRTGTLFKRAFRRKEITDMKYLNKLICYVHQNPVEAGFAGHPKLWKYSSYNAIVGTVPTLIPKQEVIELFGDLENFIYCNLKPVEL